MTHQTRGRVHSIVTRQQKRLKGQMFSRIRGWRISCCSPGSPLRLLVQFCRDGRFVGRSRVCGRTLLGAAVRGGLPREWTRGGCDCARRALLGCELCHGGWAVNRRMGRRRLPCQGGWNVGHSRFRRLNRKGVGYPGSGLRFGGRQCRLNSLARVGLLSQSSRRRSVSVARVSHGSTSHSY